jgi:predicted phage terminase large subunit-like protein
MAGSPAQLREAEYVEARDVLIDSCAASSLAAFVLYTPPPEYIMGRFHELLCDALDMFLLEVRQGKGPRLIVTAPPQHGKSEIVSRHFPAYMLGKYPDMRIIATSYNTKFASDLSLDVQRLMDSPEYRHLFPGTSLIRKGSADADGVRRQDMFNVAGRWGYYHCAGVGGPVTGYGAHVLLMDDPIKNREEADSPTIREKLWNWYTSTLFTRQGPQAGIILVQTRWHEDDLAGRLLERVRSGEGEKWRLLNFPAIAERDEGWRKEGDVLHPERRPMSKIEEMRREVGARNFAALYQQRPAPEEGDVFRKQWFRRWTPASLPERWDKLVQSWDMAYKDHTGADYVSGQVWGKCGADFYLLDQTRRRMAFVETCEAVLEMAERWPGALEIVVEDAANGPAVVDALRRSGVSGIVPVRAEGSKKARAYAVTPLFEAGNVHFPPLAGHPWVEDLEAELLGFPSAAHDDQVDAATQALRRLVTKPGDAGIASAAPRAQSWGSPSSAGRFRGFSL